MRPTQADLRGLVWLEARCGQMVSGFKVDRKYKPQADLSPKEMKLINALLGAGAAARQLREVLASG